ncbi:hypothetical protein D3C87_1890790 [compost metagenome]
MVGQRSGAVSCYCKRGSFGDAGYLVFRIGLGELDIAKCCGNTVCTVVAAGWRRGRHKAGRIIDGVNFVKAARIVVKCIELAGRIREHSPETTGGGQT